jgi:uncharacterized protein
MPTYKTPDVYIEEISVFPPSVAEVETAIPAFIGYTEIAKKLTANDLLLKPTKIYSLKEYETYFGFPKEDVIAMSITTSGTTFTVASFTEPAVSYMMYNSVKAFFDNGGGQCYITAVALHSAAIDDVDLVNGLNAVALEDEPTLLVVPEMSKLSATDYPIVAQAMLTQCGTLKDRFAIIDVRDGGVILDGAAQTANRGYFGTNNLKYGAAYYPWVKSSINFWVNAGETNVNVIVDGGASATLAAVKASNTSAYNFAKAELQKHFVVLPPSGFVAGVMAAVDTARGVWKAPANVSLADVIEPVIKVDNTKQDALNVDVTGGKSINVIRAFAGKGTLVWGARTLDGNSNEWRYVSVRRFFNMVEESVKKSTYWAVFEPNDANTWVKVRGMIESYLTQKWREGALAGATTKEAFFVRCGLGVTMSAQDILEGRMNVEIGMAVVRPAEFIILKFSHMLQTS